MMIHNVEICGVRVGRRLFAGVPGVRRGCGGAILIRGLALLLGAAAAGAQAQTPSSGSSSAGPSSSGASTAGQPRRSNDPAAQQGDAPQPPAKAAVAAPPDDEEKRGARPRRTLPRVSDWSRMSAEEQAELEQFIAKWFPEVWTELEADRESKPRVYRQRMERLAQEIVPLIDQYDQSPQRGQLSIREWQFEFRLKVLVSDYLLEGTEERRGKLVKDISQAVTDRFQVRQQRRWLDIVSLEERLLRLKELHAEKTQNQAKIIQREIATLINPGGASDEGATEDERPAGADLGDDDNG